MLDLALENWSFVAAWGTFYAIGVVMKRGPLSEVRAETSAVVRFIRRWFPLPLHPIAAGVALGSLDGVPLPDFAAAFELGGQFYYGGAGLASIVWHDIYREWRKHEGEPDPGPNNRGIGLSGEDLRSGPPPAPPS